VTKRDPESPEPVWCPVCNAASEEVPQENQLRKDLVVIIISASLLSLGLVLHFILRRELEAGILLLLAASISGYKMAVEGFSTLVLRRRFSIDFLIIIAAAGSFFIGHGEEGATVVFLFFVAEFLEHYSSERARKSIASMMKLAPDVATVRRDEEEVVVHVHDVAVGETIVVRPGERIPLDGEVIRGSSAVDQAPITGESIPVTKEVGSTVYAGTINKEGYLEIRTTKPSGMTFLDKIVSMVEEARKQKSGTEKFIDRFSRVYTPVVIMLALGVATIPTFVFGGAFNQWIYRALVLLVISCPCALAISTPVAIVSGITGAARNGVMIKGGAFVEEVSKVKAFAFDKTGTLTTGEQEVADLIALEGTEGELLSLTASLEKRSEHPIAKAILERAEESGAELREVSGFRALPGRGVRGRIGSKDLLLGSPRMFTELGMSLPEKEIEGLESQGKTVLLLGTEKKALGIISVSDRIREDAKGTVEELARQGISTIMLTGDNERTAKAFAAAIGVSEYHAELLPPDKVLLVEELSKRYGHVAMVGDGVNDAPALARADVGIAMGAMGSDVSLETADIALMEDHLCKIPYLIHLSRRTEGIVKQNVWISILIKGSFAILAFPGLITLWLAVAVGDMGLSLAVIANAMRISRTRSPSAIPHLSLGLPGSTIRSTDGRSEEIA